MQQGDVFLGKQTLSAHALSVQSPHTTHARHAHKTSAHGCEEREDAALVSAHLHIRVHIRIITVRPTCFYKCSIKKHNEFKKEVRSDKNGQFW